MQLGLSLEKVEDLLTMEANIDASSGTDGGTGVGSGTGGGIAAAGAAASTAARGIALDLFNFMESFRKPGQAELVVPPSIFESWIRKFTSKVKRDPNFYLKKGAGGLGEF